MKQAIKKNQIIDISITGLTQDGNGVGRDPGSGMVVFVPLTAPGDVLRVKIVKVLRSHAFGIIEELLEPAACRVENRCPAYKRCGGCSMRHISYEREMEEKEAWVTENLRRIGHIQVPMDAPIPSQNVDRYRNKAQYPVRRVNGRITTGFFSRRSHTLIPVEDCLLQPELFRDISACLCQFMEDHGIEPYEEADHSGLVRTLFLRHAAATGQVMVCIVINGGFLPEEDALVRKLREACPAIASVILSINRERGNVILGRRERILYGDSTISDVLCGVNIQLSARSFYQVNHHSAQLLYEKALEYAAPTQDSLLLDLYCGVGTIGLSMAGQAGQLIGVEIIEDAIEDARRNATANGVDNAEFICGDASAALEELRQRKLTPDIVLLDPPRKGVAEEALVTVAAMAPQRIVYISCNSATLARDCAKLEELGYRAEKACAVDMFPRTGHVETVVLMIRKTQ